MNRYPSTARLLRHGAAALLALALAGAAAVQAQEDENEIETKVVTKMEQVPARGRHHFERAKVLENLEEGYKVKLEIGRYFDQGQTGSTNKFEPYVVSYVPVNPDGEEDGIQRCFSQRGKVVREVTWKDGVKNGPEKIYHSAWPKHYERARIPWKNGVIEGTKKTFFEGGKVKSETPYVDGKPHGVSKSYSKTGKVTRECTLKNGERHGKLIDYWPRTGEKRREITYDNGKVKGMVREYHRNGQLRRAVPFKDEAMHGVEKRYNEDGSERDPRYWINGNMVTKTEFELKYKKD